MEWTVGKEKERKECQIAEGTVINLEVNQSRIRGTNYINFNNYILSSQVNLKTHTELGA